LDLHPTQSEEKEALPERPTVIDVARRAGVSPATVSRVMNAPDLVTEKTRHKVNQAVAELGYLPNFLAGALASNRSRVISFVAPGTLLTLFNATIQTVVQRMGEAGYQVLIGFGGSTEASFSEAVLSALARRPDGMILIGPSPSSAIRERLNSARIPIVEAWDHPRKPIDMAVGYSVEDLSREIASFVISRGYKRPFFCWGKGPRGLAIRHGITEALVAAGFDEPDHHQYMFPGQFGDGRDAVRHILKLPERPDLLLCISDWLAHGALTEARYQGLSVPRDLAICGFGDQDFAAHVEPTLTSVRIDGGEIGRVAADMLLACLAGRRPPEAVIDVGFKLMQRDSA
jgi:LacI family gluconate utilization system Gnt-I transcriptional repressor